MLPPNARAIKRARDVGQHPSEITIVYTSRWCANRYRPGSVLVLADEYKRGEYSSFAWVSGVPVICINHDRDEVEFARFVADIASWTAPVHAGPFVRWGTRLEDQFAEAPLVMWALRWQTPDTEWPDGWSGERERSYAQRVARYDYIEQRRA